MASNSQFVVGGLGGLGWEVRLALIWRIRVVAGMVGRLASNSQNWLAGLVAWGGGAIGFDLANPGAAGVKG